jgi:hypothetical protein
VCVCVCVCARVSIMTAKALVQHARDNTYSLSDAPTVKSVRSAAGNVCVCVCVLASRQRGKNKRTCATQALSYTRLSA